MARCSGLLWALLLISHFASFHATCSESRHLCWARFTMDEVDSGAATHVRPLWFGNSFPPQLRTVTDDNIQLHGYRWIYMHNTHGHPIAIPFYMCDVQQPILSVIRLAEQGFHINFNDNPPITHSKGFASSLKQKDGLYFLQHGSCRYPTTWS